MAIGRNWRAAISVVAWQLLLEYLYLYQDPICLSSRITWWWEKCLGWECPSQWVPSQFRKLPSGRGWVVSCHNAVVSSCHMGYIAHCQHIQTFCHNSLHFIGTRQILIWLFPLGFVCSLNSLASKWCIENSLLIMVWQCFRNDFQNQISIS